MVPSRGFAVWISGLLVLAQLIGIAAGAFAIGDVIYANSCTFALLL